MLLEEFVLLADHLFESPLPQVRHGGKTDVIDQVITQVIGEPPCQEDQQDRHRHQRPDVVNRKGNQLVEVKLEAEHFRHRNGNAGLRRIRPEDTVEDRP